MKEEKEGSEQSKPKSEPRPGRELCRRQEAPAHTLSHIYLHTNTYDLALWNEEGGTGVLLLFDRR